MVTRSWILNRLVSLVMLGVFAAQLFMCCCSGMGKHTCDQDHSAQEPVCAVADDHDEHHSHECHHEHSPTPASDDSDNDGCPCDHSHQHHFCIGTHIFFVAAPRAEISQPVVDYCFVLGMFDLSFRVAMASLAAENRQAIGSDSPLISCPQRSALCVYRI